ncbi:MAG: arsenite methyltransferase [Candidatus Hydrogenedentes bacterium]|nr:arsenite methyltransferase [Candidatus Hydrogenedentota bacterium]
MSDTYIHEEVKKRYSQFAKDDAGRTQAAPARGCCGGGGTSVAEAVSKTVGYTADELHAIPAGANLGLGCGNPTAFAAISEGQTVLDLGSGGGIDCFLAAKKVGADGHVIGVDMTPEMLERARANAEKGGFTNVEFRQGHIEALPVEDHSVDVVISNCVINLSPDKPQVFREIARVLKPGGQIFVSDLVLLRKLPFFLRRSMALYAGCIAGAMIKEDYLQAMRNAGLGRVTVQSESRYTLEALGADPNLKNIVRIIKWIPPLKNMAESVVSVKVNAVKPTCCGG